MAYTSPLDELRRLRAQTEQEYLKARDLAASIAKETQTRPTPTPDIGALRRMESESGAYSKSASTTNDPIVSAFQQPDKKRSPLLDAFSTGARTLSYATDRLVSGATFGLSDVMEKAVESGIGKITGKDIDISRGYQPSGAVKAVGDIAEVGGGLFTGSMALKAIKPVAAPVLKKAASSIAQLFKGVHPAIKAGVGLGGGATALETARGMIDPNFADTADTFPARFGAGLRTGVGYTLESAGSALEWKGQNKAAEALTKAGESVREGFDEAEPVEFSWRAVFDPDFYSTNVARTIPLTLSLVPAMVAGWKLGGSAASRIGLGPFGRVAMSSLGGAALSRPLESAFEAGDVYEQAYQQEIGKGKSEEDAVKIADKAAQETFNKNLALVGMDALQLGVAFMPYTAIGGRFGSMLTGRLGQAGIAAGKLAFEAGTEAAEEGIQYAIQQQAMGEEIDWSSPEAKESMFIGGLFGGVLGGAGVFNDTVKARLAATLPGEQKTQLSQSIENNLEQGTTEEEAVERAFDDFAELPEGKESIRAVATEVANELESEVWGQIEELERIEMESAVGTEEIPLAEEEVQTETAEPVATELQDQTELPIAPSLEEQAVPEAITEESAPRTEEPVQQFNTYDEAQTAIDDYEDELAARYGEEAVLYAPIDDPSKLGNPDMARLIRQQIAESPLGEAEITTLRNLYKARDNIEKKEKTQIVDSVAESINAEEDTVNSWAVDKNDIKEVLASMYEENKLQSAMDRGIVRDSKGLAEYLYNKLIQKTDAPQELWGEFDYALKIAAGDVVGPFGKDITPLMRQINEIIKSLTGSQNDVIETKGELPSPEAAVDTTDQSGTIAQEQAVPEDIQATEDIGIPAEETPPVPPVGVDSVEGTKDGAAEVRPGNATTVKTERGTAVDAQYAVVESSDLVSSHDRNLRVNPAYPQELQPRDRTRMASEAQVTRMTNTLEPEFLGESPKASEGAPIVGEDMIVESGNARVIALERAYAQKPEKAEQYKAWLTNNAEKFGISTEELSGMESPVLVRVRKSDIDRVQFAQEANEQSIAAMSATEQAKVDAEKLTDGLLSIFVPSENGDILTASNRGFVQDFMNTVIGANEKARYTSSDGSISQEGVTRIRNAVFARAYGDSSVIEKMAESTDNNVKNITNAMLIVAPQFAKMRAQINAGSLHKLDITDEISQAMLKYSQLKEEGTTVEGFLDQGTMFGGDLTSLAKSIMVAFDTNKRSAKRISTILRNYVTGVELVGDPRQKGLFGEGPKPTREEILHVAIMEVAEGGKEQISPLFGSTASDGQAVTTSDAETVKRGREAGGKPQYKRSAKDDLALLRKALGESGEGVTLDPEALTRPEFKEASKVAERLGLRLVAFNGDVARGIQQGRTIFVNSSVNDPVDYIFWHEVAHSMEVTHAEHYENLMDIALEHIKDADGLQKHYEAHGYALEDMPAEFAADVFAEAMHSDGLVKRLADRAPEVLRTLLEAIEKLLSRIKQAIKPDDSVLPYLRNAEAMMERIRTEIALPYFKDAVGEHAFVAAHSDQWQDAAAKTKVAGGAENSSNVHPMFKRGTPQEEKSAFSDADVDEYVRKGKPPQKTIRAYKLMVNRNDKLYPLFVDATKAIPMNVWLDAKEGPKTVSKTGTQKVKSKLGELAYRPGWHLGDIPLATHIGIKGPSGKIEYMNPSHVWVECEVAADVNYQEEATANGMNPKTGKVNLQKADIKRIPTDGYYRYKTNPNMTGEWIITGSMKINRILSDAEAGEIVREAGFTPLPRKPKFKTSVKEATKYNLQNSEVQERMEAASGVPQETMREKLADSLEIFKRKFTREFEWLPRNQEFAELRTALLKLNRQKGVSADKTLRSLRKITDPLNEQEYSLFTYKVIFDDLAHEAAEGRLLPFGLTPETLKNEKTNVDKDAAQNDKIQAAIQKRKETWGRLKDEYIQANESIGLKVDEKIKKEDYFRHQVLEYANTKGITGAGRKLRTPSYRGFLRKREGSTFDINTDYLQAEFEVMAQMRYDTEIARTIQVVKQHYDSVPKLKAEAVRINNANIMQVFKEMSDQINDPKVTAGSLYRKTLNKKQAMALAQLESLAARGELPAGPNNKYLPVIEQLSISYMEQNMSVDMGTEKSKADATHNKQLFEYLGWLTKQPEGDAKISALTYFKGRREKETFIKEKLADEHVSWQDIVPEGYVFWQPREGNVFFMADSVPEHVAQALYSEALESVGVTGDMLKKVLAKGQRFPGMVVKEEVALTLDNLFDKLGQNTLFTKVLRPWKQWQLISPKRFFKYNIRNLTGDLDAMVAGNPKAILQVPRAWKELKEAFFSKDGKMTPMLEEWFNRGGFETLFQAQEIYDINRNRQFKHLMESKLKKTPVETLINAPKDAWYGYWDFARKSTDFREALLRYACFLDYVAQIEKSPDGNPLNYGASNREEIWGMKDPLDKSFKLTNELLGAYDEVSVAGVWLADNMLPFWRWNEVNFVRYNRLINNAYQDTKLTADVGRRVAGMPGLSVAAAMKIGKFTLKLCAFSAVVTAWNMLFFADEEDDLSDDVKSRFHMIFGRDKQGNVLYFSRIGALQDYLDWVGLDSAQMHIKNLLGNKRTLKEIAVDMAKSPLVKVGTALGPHVTLPVGLFLKQNLYPDPLKPGRVRDEWEFIFDSFGLRDEYRELVGKPTMGYGRSLYNVFAYKSDPAQSAYYSIKDEKIRFMKKIDKNSYSYAVIESPKSEALYNVKLAMRYKDTEAAKKYLLEYVALGGTANGLKRSLESLHPLHGLKAAEKKAFVLQLDSEGREDLVKAMEYYKKIINPKGGGA